jgi:hypothetical protein
MSLIKSDWQLVITHRKKKRTHPVRPVDSQKAFPSNAILSVYQYCISVSVVQLSDLLLVVCLTFEIVIIHKQARVNAAIFNDIYSGRFGLFCGKKEYSRQRMVMKFSKC